jgi:hypothetical protein
MCLAEGAYPVPGTLLTHRLLQEVISTMPTLSRIRFKRRTLPTIMLAALAAAAIIGYRSAPASAATAPPTVLSYATVRPAGSVPTVPLAPAPLPSEGNYEISNLGPDYGCLDDSRSNGLRMFGCNNASYASGYQQWNFTEPVSLGFSIQNKATGLCLDDSKAYGLRMFGCNYASYASGYQQWTLAEPDGDGIWQIRNAATGLCLDNSSQYRLRMFGCNNTSFNNGYQSWGVTY